MFKKQSKTKSKTNYFYSSEIDCSDEFRKASELEQLSASDYQIGGDHYQRVPGEQLWDRLVRLFGLEHSRVFFIGNIIAYLERYQYKDGIEGLRKAQHYIKKLIELEESEGLEK